MNYWVFTAGRYWVTYVLGKVHAAFFTSHHIETMIYLPDEIILPRMMTALDIELEKAMYYYDKGYESDNDYGLPPQVVKPVCIYSVFTAVASYNLAEYKVTQCPISPFTPR